ncbi:MAG: hypothetical protein AABZ60_09800 [Planctomycetota bacterium]
MLELLDILRSCQNYLPSTFVSTHQRFFTEEEPLQKLAKRLLEFSQAGVPTAFPLPHFHVECTPPLSTAYIFFEKPIKHWKEGSLEPSLLMQQFANALIQADCKNILILLGQRLTPASLTDARAIPPSKAKLMASASQEYAQGLTVGARALTKHVHRSPDQFWGEIKGSTEEKNKLSLHKISTILDQTTWWNIFGHYKHDIVFEARVPEGQGARWGHGGSELIGFLEPFLSEEEEKLMSEK